ncbi:MULTISPECIES: hypothetical protein [Vibrio]|uniref:Uncharacterized protein n=1 Tax=Vibrio halioticoli NBRC 102217 TaxID=1219072 RepID=V5HMR7_9VIBR|nr:MULTISPECIES: hypothetical protein [Vibrio]MPW37339.1 hypothetical protein [Vibrio sp. B1Z05]GAD90505.1 hypothetical protein VHA01S_046_00140 [Vibrio halioticoli NBRC 102217]
MTINKTVNKTISTIAFIAFSSSSFAHDSDISLESEFDDYAYEVFLDSPDPSLTMVFNEDGLQHIELDDQRWDMSNDFRL